MAELSMTDRQEIVKIVKTFIIDNFLFGNGSEMIDTNQSFMENGIIDSTGILELVEFVEEHFGITINDDELIPENLDSLENISLFIRNKTSA